MLTRRLTFAAAWAEAGPRLHSTLRRRGVEADAADDVVQETATRAIEHEVEFEDVDDLLRWANVVAWRIVLNQWRRRRWVATAPVPDGPAAVDVDDEALARYTLGRVAASMSRLSPSDRDALRPVNSPISRTEATRRYVRRHRARARLAAMLDGLAGVLAWLFWSGERSRSRAAMVAIGAPLLVMATLTLPHLGSGPESTPLREGRGTELAPVDDAPATAASKVSPTAKPIERHGAGSGSGRERGIVPIPLVDVDVNDDVGVEVRPKEPEDHLACWDADVAPEVCVDNPEAVEQLFAE